MRFGDIRRAMAWEMMRRMMAERERELLRGLYDWNMMLDPQIITRHPPCQFWHRRPHIAPILPPIETFWATDELGRRVFQYTVELPRWPDDVTVDTPRRIER